MWILLVWLDEVKPRWERGRVNLPPLLSSWKDGGGKEEWGGVNSPLPLHVFFNLGTTVGTNLCMRLTYLLQDIYHFWFPGTKTNSTFQSLWQLKKKKNLQNLPRAQYYFGVSCTTSGYCVVECRLKECPEWSYLPQFFTSSVPPSWTAEPRSAGLYALSFCLLWASNYGSCSILSCGVTLVISSLFILTLRVCSGIFPNLLVCLWVNHKPPEGRTHVSYLFKVKLVLLYSSGGSHDKYTRVVCHSLLQWSRFCQNSPL